MAANDDPLHKLHPFLTMCLIVSAHFHFSTFIIPLCPFNLGTFTNLLSNSNPFFSDYVLLIFQYALFPLSNIHFFTYQSISLRFTRVTMLESSYHNHYFTLLLSLKRVNLWTIFIFPLPLYLF